MAVGARRLSQSSFAGPGAIGITDKTRAGKAHARVTGNDRTSTTGADATVTHTDIRNQVAVAI